MFATRHRVSSQGYAIIQATMQLLPQYETLSTQEINDVKRSGACVTGLHENIEIVYTGDTTFDGLLSPENRFIFNASVLIIELTYLDGDEEKAVTTGHIHLNDIIRHADIFKNQQIVFCHISPRYSPWSRAVEILRKHLPPAILCRAYASLYSFGSMRTLTELGAKSLEGRVKEVGWGWGQRKGDTRSSLHESAFMGEEYARTKTQGGVNQGLEMKGTVERDYSATQGAESAEGSIGTVVPRANSSTLGVKLGHIQTTVATSTQYSKKSLARKEGTAQAEAVEIFIECPTGCVGKVIGSGGNKIRELRARSGATIRIDQDFSDKMPPRVIISGSRAAVDSAAKMVEAIIADSSFADVAASASTDAIGGSVSSSSVPDNRKRPSPSSSANASHPPHRPKSNGNLFPGNRSRK